MSVVPVAIGLGSNLGCRLTHLEVAISALRASVNIRRCSAVYETDPMHLTDQPPFLNTCCVGDTGMAPGSLLEALKDLERHAGRDPDGPRFGPRKLDMDLLLYGDMVIEETDLYVPHPRMLERPFVLCPLAEIAGRWIHPVTGRSVAEMAAKLSRESLRAYAPALTWHEGGS